MPKFEKAQITCNCFGIAVPSQQKYFLARKRQTQECQSPQPTRRVVKSTELKHQSEGKAQKKSLKKRPGSFAFSDHNYHNSELPKLQNELEPTLIQEVHLRPKHIQVKGAQSPTFAPKPQSAIKFPETTTLGRMPSYTNHQREHIQVKTSNFQFINSTLSIPKPIEPIKSTLPIGYPQLHFRKQNSQRQQPPNIASVDQVKLNLAHPDTRCLVSARQMKNTEVSAPPTPFYSEKNIRSHTQDWSPPFQDPSLAADFEKFFRNKEDGRNEANFTKERANLKPREAQKSKRFQQQQLMGRFAQSEDEGASQSPASQVIGKGFDRSYQDFLDQEQPIVGEQTKASRSTNTKVSNLRCQRPTFDEHQKRKFGTLAHFTSYDRL